MNDDAITDLQTLIRQPSVSAKNQGLDECANLVVQTLFLSQHGKNLSSIEFGDRHVSPFLIQSNLLQ